MGESTATADLPPTDWASLSRVAIEQAPWPMAAVEGGSHIVRAINPAFCRLIEKTKLELIGQPFAEALPANDGCLTSMDRVFQTGQSEVHQLHDDEQLRFSFPYYTVWALKTNDRPVGVMIQLTETVVQQENLRAMNEALVLGAVRQTELMEAVTFARTEAESAGLVKDRFLAMLSHELRTPLTPVVMALGMLNRTPDLPLLVSEAVEMIARNVRLEIQLIDQILDFVRIGRSKLELALEPVDLHQLLLRCAELVAPDIESKSQRLTLSLDATAHQTHADPLRIQQVFWNLLKNASKFAPKAGQIHVASRSESEAEGFSRLVVEISDNGIGFDPEVGERIFESFVQASERVTREFGGLGLGLSISKVIVEAHGGKIRATSRGAGTGATFTLELPLARQAVSSK